MKNSFAELWTSLNNKSIEINRLHKIIDKLEEKNSKLAHELHSLKRQSDEA